MNRHSEQQREKLRYHALWMLEQFRDQCRDDNLDWDNQEAIVEIQRLIAGCATEQSAA